MDAAKKFGTAIIAESEFLKMIDEAQRVAASELKNKSTNADAAEKSKPTVSPTVKTVSDIKSSSVSVENAKKSQRGFDEDDTQLRLKL